MGPYEMFRVNEDTVGNYSCVYWIMPSIQEIWSPQSNLVFIAMADHHPSPTLIVDPPPGAVNEGDSLNLTCLTNEGETEKKFTFYRDGLAITFSDEGSVWSFREPGTNFSNATVSILKAKLNHSGKFACSYEEEVSGRWVTSSWSQTVKIMVKVPDPSPPSGPSLAFAYLAVPFVILMILLIFYCGQKKTGSYMMGFEDTVMLM
ncbi:uncharacterized protein LOC128399232 [Podarcis raffonei]|uniref:uncharacterized protein LOC128399232 n=1 Tax=Podarcis raffonei TaxID=65483 RepID=UPI0023298E10|nr:uncharacterized protein LOC128399232 [Podarcis raffonei]